MIALRTIQLKNSYGQSFMFFAEAKAATKVSCSLVLTVAAAAGYDYLFQ